MVIRVSAKVEFIWTEVGEVGLQREKLYQINRLSYVCVCVCVCVRESINYCSLWFHSPFSCANAGSVCKVTIKVII